MKKKYLGEVTYLVAFWKTFDNKKYWRTNEKGLLACARLSSIDLEASAIVNVYHDVKK